MADVSQLCGAFALDARTQLPVVEPATASVARRRIRRASAYLAMERVRLDGVKESLAGRVALCLQKKHRSASLHDAFARALHDDSDEVVLDARAPSPIAGGRPRSAHDTIVDVMPHTWASGCGGESASSTTHLSSGGKPVAAIAPSLSSPVALCDGDGLEDGVRTAAAVAAPPATDRPAGRRRIAAQSPQAMRMAASEEATNGPVLVSRERMSNGGGRLDAIKCATAIGSAQLNNNNNNNNNNKNIVVGENKWRFARGTVLARSGGRAAENSPCRRPGTSAADDRLLSRANFVNSMRLRSTQHKATAAAAFDQQDLVFDQRGALLGGSIAALVARLTPRQDYAPDRNYMFTFLLGVRAFVAPCELLHEIEQQCLFEQNDAAENFRRERRTRFSANILRLCAEWAESFPYDFADATMARRLRELLSLCSADRASHAQSAALLRALDAKLARLDRYEKALADIEKESHGKHKQSTLLDIDGGAGTFAQQLTHIELERLSMIGPEEFVHELKQQADSELADCKAEPAWVSRTGNIGHYINWFNRLTSLVGTEITRHHKKRLRARAVEFFIDTAKECFNLGNFNSLMAIVNGLNSTPVTRLKRTWSRVDTSKLDILQHQLDPSANFTSYRATLKAAVWRAQGARDAEQRIVIPFFSLYMKDLLAVHRKAAKRLPNGHVNYAMMSALAEHVRQFMRWRHSDCPFARHCALLQYAITTPVLGDTALQLVSFEREQPESAAEKEAYRRLRSEQNASK